MEIGTNDLKNVFDGIIERDNAELFSKDQAGLESYWMFSYDDTATIEKNTYLFFKALEMYQKYCRRWEEYHNGGCCVVERVREKYLMPKICEFWITMAGVAGEMQERIDKEK